MARTKVILDVDTGTDDAVAIMLAGLSDDIDLIGCTTVWGNSPVENTTDNTLRVLDHIGRSDVPVYKGLGKPYGPARHLANQDETVVVMHPPQLALPESTRAERPERAVEWLVDTIKASSDPVTLVPVGPLTNIAAAITLDPSIVDNVAEIIIMGGAHDFGNVTASAEANIWHDPIAADVVFRAGFERLILVPLDATHKALVTSAQTATLRGRGTPAASAAADLIDVRITAHTLDQPQSIPDSAAVHDPLCIAYLIDPGVIELTHCYVAIETIGEHTFGRTVVDLKNRSRLAPNAHVALNADADKFFAILERVLGATS